MQAKNPDRQRIIEQNRQDYGDIYDRLRWPDSTAALRASRERQRLLDDLRNTGVGFGCRDSKIDCRNLSPGCRSCADGTWSCLFINGICRAGCFFCPAPQKDTGQPATSGVTFDRAQDYIDYLEAFRFEGVGISGGEPLRTPERTLSFITKIKKRFDDRIHLWLYTNGTLVDKEKLLRLKRAGLDEIRFNIVANGYRLEPAATAVGIIPVVTVEIPAIPEDFELMKRLIPEMKEVGISHLNLHQMRLTPHNHRNLSRRKYTYLHAPQIVVLESELTALRLMKFNEEQHIHLPINYCAYIYKNRYQSRSARRRHGGLIKKSHEALTETGMIRSLAVSGDAANLRKLAGYLQDQNCDPLLWQPSTNGSRIYFHPSLWQFIDFNAFSLVVSYHNATLKSSPTYRNPFKEIELNPGKSVLIERWPVFSEIELKGEYTHMFGRLYIDGAEDSSDKSVSASRLARFSRQLGDIPSLELIPPALQEYY